MKYLRFYAVMSLVVMGTLTGCGGESSRQKADEVMATEQAMVEDEAVAKEQAKMEDQSTLAEQTTGGESAVEESDNDKERSKESSTADKKAGDLYTDTKENTAGQKAMDLSIYISSYQQILKNIEATYDEYCMYALYDIDEDGILELITIEGTCEADDLLHIYKYDGKKGKAVEIPGEDNIGDAALYKDPDREGIITVQGKQGYQTVRGIILSGGKMQTEMILQGELAQGEEYYQTDEPIEEYMVNDYSALGL